MAERIDRRAFLARGAAAGAGVAALGAAGGGLAACGSRSAPESGPSGTSGHPNGVSTATAQKGGQLIFGTEAEEKGFSTTQGTFDTTGIMYARTVFDPLAIIDADGNVQPYLAQSILPNGDYTVWTITMRPNLAFHNGAPCDGAAVAENFALQQSSGLTGPEFTTISKVSVPSPLVVTVTMKSAWVPFDFYLAGGVGGQIAFIAEPNWLKSGSQTNPIGTGPFVFQAWNPDDYFTATRNPHYWRPEPPLPRQHHLQAHPRQRAAPGQPRVGRGGHHPHLHLAGDRRASAPTPRSAIPTTPSGWPGSRTCSVFSSTCPSRHSTTSRSARRRPCQSARPSTRRSSRTASARPPPGPSWRVRPTSRRPAIPDLIEPRPNS